MAKIIGIIVVFASVLGGYVLSHGKIAALIQPFEVLIIGGGVVGHGIAWAARRSGRSVALIDDGARLPALHVAQGDADRFLKEQLRPELLERACASA